MRGSEPIKSREVIKRIISNTKKSRNKLLLSLGFSTGYRIGDLLRIRVKDVKYKTHLNLREQKTKKERSILIQKNTRKLIEDYVKNKNDSDYLFKSQMGNKAITRQMAYLIIKKECCKEVENIKIGCHTMRKSFATMYYNDTKKDLKATQHILNHSNINDTADYLAIYEELQEKVLMNWDI